MTEPFPEDVEWFLMDVGVVRESKMTGGADFEWGPRRSVHRQYDGDNVLRFESETRKHHLRREWELEESGRQTIRYYWRRLRVPWLVWAMFS